MSWGSLWSREVCEWPFVDGDRVARETEDLGQRWRESEGRLARGGQVVGLGKGMAGKEYVCLGELWPELV